MAKQDQGPKGGEGCVGAAIGVPWKRVPSIRLLLPPGRNRWMDRGVDRAQRRDTRYSISAMAFRNGDTAAVSRRGAAGFTATFEIAAGKQIGSVRRVSGFMLSCQ